MKKSVAGTILISILAMTTLVGFNYNDTNHNQINQYAINITHSSLTNNVGAQSLVREASSLRLQSSSIDRF